ncbi:hypothetical protein CgunFtcFv8_009030 [Champsocephalus gunnari]|uniref:G-protein coupled receptors family 1 profile domain-containing protein n=1 Tax=Champsocephalus gunnari TaxID=52237 RepID=A0AAN8HG98_CHAGU|nr:hypothetical protein CgunFtcFv8_009030 [Champsocephalus gunnari]
MDFEIISNASFPPFSSAENLTEEYEQYINGLMPSIFGVICFLGTFGNSIVIYTIVKKTKFCSQQTVPDILIFSLSTADLLFLLGMPFLIHQLLGNGSWCFGGTMCTVITALDSNSQMRKFIVAVQPSHCRVFRVAPAALADGSMSLRLAPDSSQPSQSARELLQSMLPVTVAVH